MLFISQYQLFCVTLPVVGRPLTETRMLSRGVVRVAFVLVCQYVRVCCRFFGAFMSSVPCQLYSLMYRHLFVEFSLRVTFSSFLAPLDNNWFVYKNSFSVGCCHFDYYELNISECTRLVFMLYMVSVFYMTFGNQCPWHLANFLLEDNGVSNGC